MEQKADAKEFWLVAFVVALGLFGAYLLHVTAPVGYVIYVPTPATQTFDTQTFNLTCSAESTQDLINISAQLIGSDGIEHLVASSVSGMNVTVNLTFSGLRNDNYDAACIACDGDSCMVSNESVVVLEYTVTAGQLDPVINLTFDDASDPWKDYSNLNHIFTDEGAISWADQDNCKWYGCADLTATSGDYLESNTKFGLQDGIAVSFWVYHEQEPTSSSSQAYYRIGETSDGKLKWTQQAQYGYVNAFDTDAGQASHSIGSSKGSLEGVWEQVFVEYDGSTLTTWINGKVAKTSSGVSGTLLYDIGELLYVGRGLYGIDVHGYLDEFVVWNRGNFTNDEVQAYYNRTRLGTPPARDIYVKGVSYVLPYDWSSSDNSIDLSGNLDLNVTIANAGTLSTGSFDTDIIIDGATVCSHTSSLDAFEQESFICSWPKSAGWHTGSVTVDVDDDVSESDGESNNGYYVYIPLVSHPRFRFTQDAWDDELKPVFTDNSVEIAYESYNRYLSFVSEDFSSSWSAADVDPRAKKGFQNAFNCYENNYVSSPACEYAMNHLEGWLIDVDDWADGSVQALHEVIHVAATYDLMFPSLSEEDTKRYAKALQDICFDIYGKSNVRPDTDSDDPKPENGRGFGTGLSAPCYVGLGDVASNPNMDWKNEQSYVPVNTIYYWNNRLENHLKGFKDDPDGFYPEGMLYHWYSKYHLVDILWFLKLSGLSNIPEDQQNTICSWTKETARFVLDHNYNGASLRNDEGNTWRQISFGDTNSYENIGSDGIHGWDVISVYGLLCDDQDVKDVARTLRYYGYSSGQQTRSTGGVYYYSLLTTQASLLDDIGSVLHPYAFAKSFDRYSLRRGFTYTNDSLFIVNSGDEAGSGHPNAEFDLFVYVFGEPFLDYPQVPYEDDVRSEVWYNTISFTQSDASGYNTNYASAALNQYYGGEALSGSYPDYQFIPSSYVGDVTGVIGSRDGRFGAAHATRGYVTATEPVARDVVIFDDILAHADYVKRSVSGPIYANWINIYDEFSPTIAGANLTLRRVGTDKYYTIRPLWSSAGAVSLAGGDSGKAYCFKKTDCSSSGGNYGKYYHSVSGPQATTVFAHHWYLNSPKASLSLYAGADRGVVATYTDHTSTIVFDTDEDGSIDELGYVTNGWSLAATSGIVAATGATSLSQGSTTLFSSSEEASVYIDRSVSGVVNVTVNVFDEADVEVWLGADAASVLLDGVPFSSFSVSSQTLSLSVPAGNHELEVFAAGDAAPFVVLSSPASGAALSVSSVDFSCSASDDRRLVNVSLLLNGSVRFSVNPASSSYALEQSLALPYGSYSWSCVVTDNASQSTTGSRAFTLSAPVVVPVVSSLAPAHGFSTTDSSVNFSCSVVDDNLVSLSLFVNNPSWSAAASTAVDSLWSVVPLSAGSYTWACRAIDGSGQTAWSTNRSLTVSDPSAPPSASSFDGRTTDFSSLGSFDSVALVLERVGYGRITFLENVSVAGADLDSLVAIDHLSIGVDAAALPSLDVPAILTFENMSLAYPRVLRDGVACSGCVVVRDGLVLNVSVPGFSTYTIVNNPPAPASESSSGGGGGGGSSISSVPVVEQPAVVQNVSVNESGNASDSEPVYAGDSFVPVQETPGVVEAPLDVVEDSGRVVPVFLYGLIGVVVIALFMVVMFVEHRSGRHKSRPKIGNR